MGHASRLLAAALGLTAVSARSIVDYPLEVRQANVVRLSRKECDECATLEAFYEANPMGFVLFFERALVGSHKYKEAIVRGFHETCADLRFSRVACGVVDMVEDREYAERYIDPKTAPAHIVVQNGEPVVTLKSHIDALMKKPGDKATILWHIHELLSPDDVPVIAPGALRLSSEVSDAEALDGLIASHEVVILGGVSDRKTARDTVRAAFQGLQLRGEVPGEVPLMPLPDDEPKKRKKRRQKRILRQRSRVIFLAVHGKKALGSYNLTEGAVAAFVRGKPQPVRADLGKGSPDEPEAVEAVRKVVLAATATAKDLQAKEAAAAAEAAMAAAPDAGAAGASPDRPARGKGGKGAGSEMPKMDL